METAEASSSVEWSRLVDVEVRLRPTLNINCKYNLHATFTCTSTPVCGFEPMNNINLSVMVEAAMKHANLPIRSN